MYIIRCIILALVILFVGSVHCRAESGALSVNTQALARIFSGEEVLHYNISWSGGVKIGDLYLVVARAESGDGFAIHARVTDYGLFRMFYPVDDTFTTFVRGSMILPYRYEVLQKEGHGERITRRLTLYDQQRLRVSYQKNKQPPKKFSLSATAYNEFSSFIITRALEFQGDEPVVPTFVDEKRHEVSVVLMGREKKSTLFGEVDTLKVMPKMNFKGLYNKDGETVFWLTDDACRVPVVINSKIVIGSLTADLLEYTNPACPELTGGGNE